MPQLRLLAAILAAAALAAADSPLQRVQQEVHAPRHDAAPSPGRSSSGSDGSHGSSSGDADDSIVSLIEVIGDCWTLFGSGDGHPRGSYAPQRHPYADGDAGWLAWRAPRDLGEDGPDAGRPRYLAGDLEALAARIDDDLVLASAAGRLLLPLRFEGDLRWSYYREDLPAGVVDLHLVDADLRWRLLQWRNAEIAVGGGLTRYHDAIGGEHGAYAVGHLHLYPVRPLVLRLEGQAGTLGGTLRRRWSAEVGCQLGALEPFAGWSAETIGDVDLHGPLAGLRWWL